MLSFQKHLISVVDSLFDELPRKHNIFVVQKFGDEARVNLMNVAGRLLDEVTLAVVTAVLIVEAIQERLRGRLHVHGHTQ